ncbi:P-loop containing nucleoside triphosphate hydrolase protein [Mycena metata]|uniref:DNA 3'-5' helicase n=1 Tax=Mycena metata TaxID=1033252 RepID=A0AAD7JMN3_9AGAR|nr:P-loop containing nucleoside triphosphate hydrolase protein [Mycena metata]
MDTLPLPMSSFALTALRALPPVFMASLTTQERVVVVDAFLYLDFASKGTKAPRELQLRAAIAVKAGEDLLVRSGTGTGKTLAMILPVLSMAKDSVVITISPLRLIQDNHVAEFGNYGIPSIAINCYTPNDPELWKVLIKEHTIYQHYSVSPEQCGSYQGHITNFAKLLHDPKWTKRVKLLQIDEAHFIATTGQANGKDAAFRPAFSDLGERIRVHLPSTTPCTAYSASMPPRIMEILTKTLRMEPERTIKIELPTNRPNLVYAAIPMVGSIDNFRNVTSILIPSPCPPNFIPRKGIVFLDNKKKAAKLARDLNEKLPPALAAQELFRHYHSSMSKPYLEECVRKFKEGTVRCLIATESASNGFDIPDIELIILFGVPKSKYEEDQRGGRGGRDGRECLVLLIAEKWAYYNLAETDDGHKPCDKEKRTDRDVVVGASSKSCRRRILAKHNNDSSAIAHNFCGRWCCDNDTDDFDITTYLEGPVLNEDDTSDSGSPLQKQPRKKYRPVAQREPIEDALRTWRSSAHNRNPISKNFPISYILDDPSIVLLARERPVSLRIPSDVTNFLGETQEWHSQYALDIVSVLRRFELGRPTIITQISSSDNNSDDNSQDSDSDSIPTPTDADKTNTIAPSANSSPTSSRASSPDIIPTVSSTGRPLRRSALNHKVAGIATQLSKKQKT